jgi:enhancer of polycomb-like protein
MSTEDDEFLTTYNQKRAATSKCSEDVFERIMEILEVTAARETPHSSIDGFVLPFETMIPSLKQSLNEKSQVFARDIYAHWRSRREAAGNHSIQPALKAESEPANPEKDDADPYVCFRFRDMRQARKTRARDLQSSEKLKRLRKELEEGRQLISLAHQRELLKREYLKIERNIFEQRATVKEAKVRLGIKTDDEDLINQRVRGLSYIVTLHTYEQQPQKRKLADFAGLQRPPSSLRLSGRHDGRPLDDLVQLSDLIAQKENTLRIEIEDKARQHRQWNSGHVDLTREPLSPAHGQGSETFRPATAQYQYLMTPPSSVTSETFDQPSPTQEKPEHFTFRYSSPPEEDESRGQPAYRRRIGRCGRLWIDRRGMSAAPKETEPSSSDRWKYDQDDDDEQPVYEMDPYDVKALRFRATIPFPNHLLPQRTRSDDRLAQSVRLGGSSPTTVRVVAATQQAQPTA